MFVGLLGLSKMDLGMSSGNFQERLCRYGYKIHLWCYTHFYLESDRDIQVSRWLTVIGNEEATGSSTYILQANNNVISRHLPQYKPRRAVG